MCNVSRDTARRDLVNLEKKEQSFELMVVLYYLIREVK
ncbi:DeoR family transcriptional regulator [Clostridium botulinum]|nr:DeoR family transcriptional regulator [Clostridium botulinum]